MANALITWGFHNMFIIKQQMNNKIKQLHFGPANYFSCSDEMEWNMLQDLHEY